MIILFIILLIYSGFITRNVIRTNLKRKSLRVGDICSVYLGENRIKGSVLNIDQVIDVWVLNKVVQFTKKQIYA
jgi:hypothetical protein